jgi:hypothetical protein
VSKSQQWKSRIRETWRSAISWMSWSRRRKLRRIQEQERQRTLMLLQLIPALVAAIEPVVHRQLMQMAEPLAEALQRQDNLEMERLHSLNLRQELRAEQMLELQMDLLSSLQPTAEQQLLQVLEPSTQQPSPRTSAG